MKPKVLFIYDHKYPHLWRDGLWAALNLLEEHFDVTKKNLNGYTQIASMYLDYDLILGWGAFGSNVDKTLQGIIGGVKKGLCIAGNALPPEGKESYDVLFYETEWYRPQISSHRNIVHAFGVNTDIYKDYKLPKYFWDYITVGSFSYWKRQEKLLEKDGVKLAIGEIQKDNLTESMDIISNLMSNGVMISDMVTPDKLAEIYNLTRTVYIPAEVNGGGERAVLEARACNCRVEVCADNPKLIELINSEVWDHHYYASQLKKGIESVL